MAAIRRGILDVCGAADLAGVEVVLTPSGTDGEYAALHLARGASSQPIVNIVIAPEETGGGVLAAAQGRHFARVTPSGAAARPDAAIAGLDPELIQVPTVPIRGSDGQPRPLAEIDRRGGGAGRAGDRRRQAMPGPCAGRVQDRAARAELRYRAQADRARAAWSTSWSTPVRCGCAGTHPRLPRGGLDGPRDRLEVLRRSAVRRRVACTRADHHTRVPAAAARPGLADYFSRAEWPDPLQHLTGRLADRANPLVLRWQAALWERRCTPCPRSSVCAA